MGTDIELLVTGNTRKEDQDPRCASTTRACSIPIERQLLHYHCFKVPQPLNLDEGSGEF
jgi:hypothetical protein